ncbi:MAG TPA: methyltransferase [Spongiibacteraceae bacterium]|nr:methyltransferase [Spongiibacteraceae bacterium]
MNHRQRFVRLTALLAEHRDLWQPRAFKQSALPWQGRWPALDRWLDGLSLAEAEQLAADNLSLLTALMPYLPVAESLLEVIAIPRRESPPPVLPARWDTAVPGRKAAQVLAFAGSLDCGPRPWLEWCAGKGHLGRCLHGRNGQPVVGLEWQPALVAEGNALARRLQLPVQLRLRDVHGEVPELGRADHAVALHACGQLHIRLLQQVVARGSAALSLSPCCYHLIDAAHYQPLSSAGRAADLVLSVEDLRTAVQETVTAPARVIRQRRQLQQWRLGFDVLQRSLRNTAHYLPVPSLGAEWLAGSFETFCRHCAALKGLELPAGLDWPAWEAAGARRLREVSAHDLVRLAFRRALELWLVHDRVLFLEEHGYRVALFEFCERALTPRNLLIDAQRSQPFSQPACRA